MGSPKRNPAFNGLQLLSRLAGKMAGKLASKRRIHSDRQATDATQSR
jgi:hypothetical protein